MQSEPNLTRHPSISFSLVVYFILIIALLTSSACGTIVHGFKEQVWVTSDPLGETVEVNGESVETPRFLLLSRSEDLRVSAEKDGCTKSEMRVHRRVNKWATLIGNLVLLAAYPAGVLIDFITGGAWSFEKDHIHIALTCNMQGNMHEAEIR